MSLPCLCVFMGSVSTRKDSTTVWVTSVYKDEVILIKDGEIIAKENVEVLRESSGKSVDGWLKGHHS
ncbi:hypothetical protein [Peribacillus simplex]|uniref:hypothetical protein n=2 Tax=Peribacillus TaxID=2675229 RepID=UPI003CF0CFFC